ncbi:hypothetical protein AQUCO_01700064v1 [Aquilegia coerulea]|uniref:Uncharacterized protein n=1 Tax=Aquilegia coerulea TaxID=218851 RepID=A0A2G5DL04_AQUCA|nr:hypothetical protein AQUCO_01700064v1 [Aquilegia coerulea]
MRLVEAGVSQLRRDILQKASMLLKLCDGVFKSCAPDSDEHGVALGCKEELRELTQNLPLKLCNSMSYLLSSSEDTIPLYLAFRRLIELINPAERTAVWYPDHQQIWFNQL